MKYAADDMIEWMGRTIFTLILFFSLFSGCAPKNPLVFHYQNEPENADLSTLLIESSHQNKYVREKAVQDLGKMHGDHEEIVACLIASLQDPAFNVRKAAFLALEENGLNEKKDIYLSMLISRLHWPGWRVPKQSAIDIGKMKREGRSAVSALIHVVEKKEPAIPHYCIVKREAIKALGSIGPEASRAIPCLIDALHNPDMEIRKEAISALRNMGPEAFAATGALEKLSTHDRVGALRKEALLSLQQINQLL